MRWMAMRAALFAPAVVVLVTAGILLPVAQAVEGEDAVAQTTGDASWLPRARALLDDWRSNGQQIDEAGELIGKVLAQRPGDASAYVEYARYLLLNEGPQDRRARNRFEAAEIALDQAISLAPDLARAHTVKGHVLLLRDRLAEARLSLERAEALGTEDPWLQVNFGRLLVKEGFADEAIGRFQRVIDNAHASETATITAYNELIDRHWASEAVDEVGDAYRELIARVPDHAWSHGNYALYLLCTRDQFNEGLRQAIRARGIADYGNAQLVHAAALYREWAQLVVDGQEEEAGVRYGLANLVVPMSPDRVYDAACGHTKSTDLVLQAMQVTGLGEPVTAYDAVMLAADAAPKMVPGIFIIRVQASARIDGELFLNSELDYRDPRCLSIRIRPDALPGLQARYGPDVGDALSDEVILVRGYARQVRIDFIERGMPTGKFYYQTHVVVTDASRVETMMERIERLPVRPERVREGTRS